MRAVIVGGTGLTGNILLRNLLKEDKLKQVISVSRKKVGIEDPKLLEVIVPDFKDLKSIGSELVGEYYFCALGTTLKAAGNKANFIKIDYQAILDFAAIAVENSAKSLTLISAMGVSETSPFFYNQVKAKTENAILKLGAKRLVIFRPALLVGDRAHFRLGEFLATKILTNFFKIFSSRKNNNLITYVDSLALHMQRAGLKDDEGIYFIKARDI